MSDLAIYPDGSGLASEEFSRARRHLQEQHDVISLMESFLNKHHELLFGMVFRCGCVWPEIEISWRYRSGSRIDDAKEIARLWPDADWHRERNEYRKHEIDWVCVVDGVQLYLRGAESLKPKKLPSIRGKVSL